jgi:hypothetical protein
MWIGGYVTAGGLERINFPRGWSEQARDYFWSYTFIAVFMIALVLSRVVYTMIERVMMVIALVTVVGLVLACTQERVLSAIPSFAQGLVSPQWPSDRSWDDEDSTKLLTAITFAGLGGFWTLFYSYWLREKGAGMAAHMGKITSPLTGRPQHVPMVGHLPTDTPEDARRWKQWTRFLLADNAIGVVGNLVTTLMCCLLAFALLFPVGAIPEDNHPVEAQSAFFREAWGPVGSVLFLVLATAFLSDTWMTTIDAVSRVHTDVLNAYVPPARKRSPNTWYWVFVLIAGGLTIVTIPLAQPGQLILFGAVTGFAGTVTFTICLLIWNHRILPRRLPPAFRPRRFAWVGIAISAICYIVLAGAYIYVAFLKT